ncbi:UNKNOWN [Stylonychia lemnae]|uniref:Uncharacterized protein n=1 Tax=Stylonychia lemnae TaxID=5949 RepID=A0A077ZV22_STYLE|nr:UNKNOWN [Stylonychia lemnae]|eukprot:CDW73740.1 UNKNOWN [Stylonychia lemnae]
MIQLMILQIPKKSQLKQDSEQMQIKQSSLYQSVFQIKSRMEELQQFYDDNIDDQKVFFFEKLRLKLKKALHSKTNRIHGAGIGRPNQISSQQQQQLSSQGIRSGDNIISSNQILSSQQRLFHNQIYENDDDDLDHSQNHLITNNNNYYDDENQNQIIRDEYGDENPYDDQNDDGGNFNGAGRGLNGYGDDKHFEKIQEEEEEDGSANQSMEQQFNDQNLQNSIQLLQRNQLNGINQNFEQRQGSNNNVANGQNNQNQPSQWQELIFRIKLTQQEYDMFLREKAKRLAVK